MTRDPLRRLCPLSSAGDWVEGELGEESLTQTTGSYVILSVHAHWGRGHTSQPEKHAWLLLPAPGLGEERALTAGTWGQHTANWLFTIIAHWVPCEDQPTPGSHPRYSDWYIPVKLCIWNYRILHARKLLYSQYLCWEILTSIFLVG